MTSLLYCLLLLRLMRVLHGEGEVEDVLWVIFSDSPSSVEIDNEKNIVFLYFFFLNV